METPAEQTTANEMPGRHTDLLKDALSLWDELRELSQAHFRLAALETQRAGMSLVTMIVLGVMLAVLLNVVWFGLMTIVVFGLIEHGFDTGNAILLAIACSLLLILILIGAIRRNSHYLQFPAIVRSLQSAASLDSDVRES